MKRVSWRRCGAESGKPRDAAARFGSGPVAAGTPGVDLSFPAPALLHPATRWARGAAERGPGARAQGAGRAPGAPRAERFQPPPGGRLGPRTRGSFLESNTSVPTAPAPRLPGATAVPLRSRCAPLEVRPTSSAPHGKLELRPPAPPHLLAPSPHRAPRRHAEVNLPVITPTLPPSAERQSNSHLRVALCFNVHYLV